MTSPRNTSKADPLEKLVVAMVPDGIEAQEAQGQREMVASTVLPTDISFRETAADYEALGFTFGDVDPADPLFREATLPEGWSRKGGGHAMWSGVVDERGIERVAVFYKAAFYDRKAHMNIVNVGRQASTEWIYGDGEPSLHPALTAEELRAAKDGAEEYLESAEMHPDIYGDRLPRAHSLLERIAEVSS